MNDQHYAPHADGPRPLARRQFVAGAAAAVLASAAPVVQSVAAEEPGPMLPLVDSHQHLWDLAKFRLAWLKPDDPLGRNYLMADYLAAARGLGIEQTIYMEVDVVVEQQDAEIEHISALCEAGDSPLVAAVFSGRPAEPEFRKYLARHRDNRWTRGLRQVLHVPSTPTGYCLAPAFVDGMRALGEIGWSFDLCIRPEELPNVTRLVAQCPDTQFILDHCGNAPILSNDLSVWRGDLARLAERPNVAGKISGIVAGAKPGEWNVEHLARVVNPTLDAFGPERVMFGGDWPVCTLGATLAEWVGAFRQIIADRPEAEQRKLCSENARRIYRIA